MPDTLYLFPWIMQGREPTNLNREKIECWGQDAIPLQRSGPDEWQSAVVGQSQFRFRIDRAGPFFCEVLGFRTYCQGILTVLCNGVVAADGGAFCPFGSEPDPGGGPPWCVSCSGDKRWYGYTNTRPFVLVNCCPTIDTNPFNEPNLYAVVRTVPSRFASDCLCHERDIFPPLTASVITSGCLTANATIPLQLDAPGSTAFFNGFQNLGGVNNYNAVALEARDTEGYQGFFILRRGTFTAVGIPITLMELRSCSPFLLEKDGVAECAPGEFANYRFTISE